MSLSTVSPVKKVQSTTATAAVSRKLEEFQLLRALAAAMVVCTHATDWAAAAGIQTNVSLGLRSIGAAGVDLFFVISGFIIARSVFAPARAVGAGEFVLRRVLRIVPLYWLWSAVVAVWQWKSGNTFSLEQVVKTLTFFPWTETNGYILPIVYLGWSLSYEMLFYGAVALILFVTPQSKGGPQQAVFRRWLLIGAAVLLSIASTFALSPIAWIPFLANPLWLEFAAGVVIASAYDKVRSLPLWIGAGLVLAGALVLFASSADVAERLADLSATLDNRASGVRVLWWGSAAVLLVLGVCVCFGERGLRKVPVWAVSLGDASYSWYLTQALTLAVAAKLWKFAGGGDHVGLFVGVAVVVTGVLAVLSARLIEFPLGKMTHRLLAAVTLRSR